MLDLLQFCILDCKSQFDKVDCFLGIVPLKVINTVSEPVSVCPVERNISVPADFGIPFQGVSGFLKNNLYIFL